MRHVLTLILTTTLITSAAYPQTDTDTDTDAALTVGTKTAEPFVIRNDDGSYSGISIELWHQIASRLGLAYELQETDLAGLITGVADSSFDVGAAALTLSAEREERMDFSHPFYRTGLTIAIRNEPVSGLWNMIRPFISLSFLQVIGSLLLVLFAVGILVWLFERRRNQDEFGGSAAEGIGSGFWWSAVTMTTVGYGDKSPRTLGGRLVALVWMFVAVIIISSFTAAITSTVTVSQLQTPVEGPSDLPNVRVGTVANSIAAQYLQESGVSARSYPTISDLLHGLAENDFDAAVYDAPILRYRIKEDFAGRLTVLDVTFNPQDYGIALPENSPLREAIDRELLRVTSEQWWEDILVRYLGRGRA